MKIEHQLQLALSHLNRGKFESAVEICQRVLRQYPRCGVAYRIFGNIREAEKQLNEAALAYTKAIELQPDDSAAYAHLAQLYRDVGWVDDAVLLYKTAVQFQPNWTDLHYHLGEALFKQGSISEAISSYKRAIAQNPKYVQAYLGLALVFKSQRQIDRAIELLQQAIDLAPNYTEAYNVLGCFLLENQQSAAAVEIFQKAIAQNPDWAILHNNIGRAWLAEGKKDRAISAYYRALELQPDLTVSLTNLGKLYQQHNSHKKAVDYFQKALEKTPENILAYTDCGYSLQQQGQMDRAMACYQKAIALDPKFVEAYCRRLESVPPLETETDEWHLAQNACVRFLRTLQQFNFNSGNLSSSNPSEDQSDPPNLYEHLIEFYLHFANALALYGTPDQAVLYYRQALEIQPQRAEIYLRLVECLIQQKRWNLAIAMCDLARAFADKNQQLIPEFDLMLGYIAEKQQRWETAIDYYTKLLRSGQGLNADWMANWTGKIDDFSGEIPPEQRPPRGVFRGMESGGQFLTSPVEYISISSASPTSDELSEGSEAPERCGGLECQPCLKRISKQFELVDLGYGITANSPEKRVPIPDFETFVAVIPNGRAWIVPQENYWKVCKAIAVMTPDNQLLANVSRDYPGQLPGCPTCDPGNHQVFQQEKLPPAERFEGSVAVLSGLSGHIYFHWMVDVLPRIELLRRGGFDLAEIDRFLVNSVRLPFQQETLNLLGIPPEKILESDRHPHLQAERLIAPSFAGHLGWLRPWAAEFLRETFLPLAIDKTENYPERIYISRAQAEHRRVMNEPEVMEVLRPLGFVEIFLESLPFSEQVRLFAGAKVIVAAHGSGLTNVVFCSKEVKVIELMSPHYERYYYRAISQYLGLEHYSLRGDGFVCYPIRSLMYPNPLTEDIWVNLTGLKRLVEVIGLAD